MTISRTIKLFALAIGLGATLFAGPLATQSAAQSQQSGQSVQKYGDWASICDPQSVNGRAPCYITQQVRLKERVALALAIGKPANQPDAPFTVIVTLPLGLRLPPGSGIEIGELRRKYAFERCVRVGCQLEFVLDSELETAFKRGTEGRVLFQDASGRTVALPFSLKGFSAALDTL